MKLDMQKNGKRIGMLVTLLGVAAIEGLYGCAGETEVQDLIEQNVGEVSEAINDSDLPACPSASGQSALASSSDSWGNSYVGASYSLQAGASNDASTGYDVWFGAKANGRGTLLGTSKSLFDMGAQVTSKGTTKGSRAWFGVGGTMLLDTSIPTSVNYQQSVTFMNGSATILIATVSLKATGTIGVTGKATLNTAGVWLTATPSARATVTGSASVGLLCISAGLSANVTMIDISVPTDGGIQFQANGGRAYGVTSNLPITSLDGNLTLDLNYCISSSHTTLINWTGYRSNTSLLAAYGCL